MTNPTEREEHEEKWMANDNYTGGDTSFFKPAQTVFFKSGTIPFIFPRRDLQTPALGRLVLQCPASRSQPQPKEGCRMFPSVLVPKVGSSCSHTENHGLASEQK